MAPRRPPSRPALRDHADGAVEGTRAGARASPGARRTAPARRAAAARARGDLERGAQTTHQRTPRGVRRRCGDAGEPSTSTFSATTRTRSFSTDRNPPSTSALTTWPSAGVMPHLAGGRARRATGCGRAGCRARRRGCGPGTMDASPDRWCGRSPPARRAACPRAHLSLRGHRITVPRKAHSLPAGRARWQRSPQPAVDLLSVLPEPTAGQHVLERLRRGRRPTCPP